MLCRHCARHLRPHHPHSTFLRPHHPHSTFLLPLRTLTTLPSSPSTAQPFSTPFTPPPTPTPTSSPTKHKIPDPLPKSSTKAGTVLKGLAYLKGQDPPVAREDAEYPPWLWGLLEGGEKVKGGEGEEEGDLFAKSKKQRRIAAKASRKQAASDPGSLVPKIPLEHQSIDLPSAPPSPSATTESEPQRAARKAREGLTSAMRRGRRKGIKEGNFLKGMR